MEQDEVVGCKSASSSVCKTEYSLSLSGKEISERVIELFEGWRDAVETGRLEHVWRIVRF